MSSAPKVQLFLKDRLIAEVAFAGDALRIGRMKENDLVINNLAVSRFHAVLHRAADGTFELEDLGSENGSEIGGNRVEGRAAFVAGEALTIGKHTVIVVPMATDEPVVAAQAEGSSDAWDAAQTYLADPASLGMEPGAPAAAEPALTADEIAPTEQVATSEAVAEAPAALMADVPEVLSADLPGTDLLKSTSELQMQRFPDGDVEAVADMAAEDAPATPSDLGTPDPDGAFSFGEDELTVDAPADLAADEGFSLLDDSLSGAAPLDTSTPDLDPLGASGNAAPPSGEHTALFDFGSEDGEAVTAPAVDAPVVEEDNDSTMTGVDTAARAVAAEPEEALTTEWSPDADAADAARPDPSLYAGWIIQRGGTLEGVVSWETDRLEAGRADSCAIVLRDTGVSRSHAVFVRETEGYRVEDAGSVNGTWVNGERVTGTRALRVGDVVKIEDFELTFVLDHQPLGSGVQAPAPTPPPPGVDPAQQTLVASEAFGFGAAEPATDVVDLVEEDEEADEKELETLGIDDGRNTQVRLAEPEVPKVKLDLEIPRDALPTALRLAMEEAGEDALRLPAEVRIKLK